MHNKLIIATFGLFFAVSGLAQTDNGESVNPEINFTNQSLAAENKIEVYPNPAVEFIIVEVSNSSLENVEFEMHSIIGNKIEISSENLSQDKYRIPVKDLASGYYFLVVKDEISRFKKAYKFLKSN
ncbi:MAG: T9SS type A sorting domain-containing protein [Cyclobacteriaceae bacterium]